jgi:serine protease Do
MLRAPVNSVAASVLSRESFSDGGRKKPGGPGVKEITGVHRKIGIKAVGVVAFVFVLLGLGVGGKLDGLMNRPTLAFSAGAPQGLPDFVTLARKLKPVVVNISATQTMAPREQAPNRFEREDPSGEFWGQFFGDNPRGNTPRRQKSLGSGFIIEDDGTILTNYHVVANAEKIVVKLVDNREFQAKVVGQDPKTDVAVIKIDARAGLAIAPLGDSDKLEVGEWVMAIGNSFGLDSTVTSGIVSAKGRHIGAGPYDNFIQTDASINPGNSGGPLINLRGEIVGINSAIVTQTGGNMGIGFATPINLVKELLPDLKKKGKVTRGALGVVIQEVTPTIADSLGMDKVRGALVAGVSKGGPAEHAGIKIGDVITEFDGKEVKEANDLRMMVARTAVNKSVSVKLLRDKKESTASVTIGELKEEQVPSPRQNG